MRSIDMRPAPSFYDSFAAQTGQTLPQCPGFCGRRYRNATPSWTECHACEWGSRARDGSYCDPCRSPLHGYDWMFLGFCAIVPLLINLSYVRVHSPKRISRTHQFLEYLSCGFECILAAIISILLYEPKWSFKLYGCQKAGYKDWYPALYNPVIGFAKTMKCSYEVVYPLFSLPLVYLAILSLIIPICRGLLYVVAFKRKRDAMAVYSAILGLPQWAILHILGAGIIFTSFPFLLLLSSLTSNAMHLSMQGRLTIRQILKLLFTSPIHITILLCNTAFFGFAVLSLTSTEDLRSLYWLLLSPLPMIFYILTIGLSHPSVLTETAA